MAGVQTARAILRGSPELVDLLPQVPLAAGDWLGDPEPWVVERPPPSSLIPAPTAPRYIERDGDMLSRPPIELDVRRLFLFVLEAEQAQLQRVCDQQLNQLGPPAPYRPFAPFVVLYCSELDNLVPPFGSCAERDFGIWLPLLRGDGADQRLVTMTSHIWVDNGIALVGGRSLFGFPKQLARLDMPTQSGDPFSFSVDTTVLPRLGESAAERRIVSIRRRDGAGYLPLTPSWSDMAQVLMAITSRGLFAGALGEVSWQMVYNWVFGDHGMRLVFLKQFPDELPGDGACYQAIVETHIGVEPASMAGGALPGDWEVQLSSFASHRIAETLGLSVTRSAGGVHQIRPVTQGWLRFSASVEGGDVIRRVGR
jgi:hypothetical protein